MSDVVVSSSAGGAVLAPSALVSPLVGLARGLSQTSSAVKEAPQAAPVVDFPRQPGGVQPSRLETIQRSLRAAGFS